MKIGAQEISKVYSGVNAISKIYLGNDLIFPSNSPSSIIFNIDDSGGAIDHYLQIKFSANDISVTVDWGDSTSDTLNAANFSGDYYTFDKFFQCPGQINISWSIGYLVELYAETNNITGDYDFSPFIWLQFLYIDNNLITAINVSGLVNLIDLYPHHNQLTSLDVTGLTSLQNLDCYNNVLVSLDVSTCTNLVTIRADNCGLTSLTIGSLLSLDYLQFNGNNLTSIDLSGLPLLTQLLGYVNSLTSIDLSQNQLLTRVFVDRNNLPISEVSNILIQLDNNSLNNGFCHVETQTPPAIPNAGGQTAKTNLEGKGWTVVVDE